MSPPPPSFAASVGASFRHHLRLLAHSRLTLVFQIAFLIALPVFVFLVGDFFADDEASLGLMLGFLPWVALVFVPALAMKTFVARPLDREREFLLTLPLSPGAIVAGAWLAGSATLLVTLAFTAPFAASVAWLGEPDLAAMAAGYLAAACLLVCFYAVGLFASAVARSEVGAFTIAIALLFLLSLFGWDGLSRIAPDGLAAEVVATAASFSPRAWMDRIASGDVQLRALASFAALTALALWGAAAALDPRGRRPALVAAGAGLAACLLLAPLIPSRLAADMTEARSFTLSEGTRAILGRLPAGARAEFFWIADPAETPAAIRAYADRVRDLLALMAERSGGRLAFVETHGAPDGEAERAALGAGLRRAPMSSGDAFVLGAAFTAGARRIPIAYFDRSREPLLEYDLATALSGLARGRALKVGVISPLLAPGDPQAAKIGFNAVEELRKAYDVAVAPAFADAIPGGLDALVVVGATFMKREMLRSIDEAVARGMGLIVMIDPRLRLSPSNDRVSPQPSAEIDDISDLLLKYGVRYRGDEVVGDARLATPVADASERTVTFPYWMRFGASDVSQDHAVTTGLKDLLFVEPGFLEADAAASLVATTGAAGAASPQEMRDKTPAALAAAFASGGGRRAVAVEVDRPVAASAGGEERRRAAVFAVADIDWILDPFAYEPASHPDAVRKPRNDNLALFLNMVERAAGGGDLIAIRARARTSRPLTRVAAVARELTAAESDGRAAATTRVAEVEKRIAALPAAAGVADVGDLPPEIRRRVEELREGLASDRRTLRQLRRRERAALEGLRARVILFNLAAGPALALALAGGVALLRRRRFRRPSPP